MLPSGPRKKQRRLRPLKPRKVMSTKFLIRKSFLQIFEEYKENCSVSGVKEMCDRDSGPKLRFLRTIIFVFAFGILCYFFYKTGLGILTRPLVLSTDSTTYPIGKIDFPAVALCNVNRISKKALREVVLKTYQKFALNNETIEEVEKFCLNFGRFIDFSYDAHLPEKFLKISASRNNTREITDTMKILAPDCSEMLIQCSWLNELVNCSTLFTVRRTGRGHCCVFNYVLDYDSASSPNNTIAEVRRQEFPGYLNGLSVIMDPLLEDYAYPINNFKGFDVLLFDPAHFADLNAGRMSHRIAEPGYATFLELKSTKQIASPEVRKYPLSVRKCLFKDESQNFGNMYSYSACIVRCRIKTVQSLCKCTPYFLPIGENEGRVCTIDDLLCLNKHKEKLLYMYPYNAENLEGLELEMEDSLFCPHCLPDCELTEHFVKDYNINVSNLRDKIFYEDTFTTGVNMTNKCIVSVYHPDSDSVLERLDVVFYWYEILSSIGGFAGVLIGISVISAVEIIYYVIVRFLIVLRINYVKYR